MKTFKWVTLAALTTGVVCAPAWVAWAAAACGGLVAAGVGAVLLLNGGLNLTNLGL
jgi:hypothetical protein